MRGDAVFDDALQPRLIGRQMELHDHRGNPLALPDHAQGRGTAGQRAELLGAHGMFEQAAS